MTTVDFREIINLIPSVIDGFSKFLDEPEAYKQLWRFDVQGNEDPDDGYVRKSGGEYDSKILFHFRLTLPSYLREIGVDAKKNGLWLADCNVLYNYCLSMQYAFAAHLDEKMPGYNFLGEMQDEIANTQHVLRLISYDVPEEGNNILGKDHQDKSLITTHVWESHPGLCISSGSFLYRSEPYKSLVFLGKKSSLITGGELDVESNLFFGGILKALIHCIKDESVFIPAGNRVLSNAKNTRRFSVIFFGHINVDLPGRN